MSNTIDSKSFIGSIIASVSASFTPNEWATFLAIAAGATTIVYNAIKIIQEIRHRDDDD